MAIDIIVPPLSQTMDTVVLVEWLKVVGDEIVKGEPLFVVETDKANLEIEAPVTGILQQILAVPGSEVQARSTIGVVTAAGEPSVTETEPSATIEPRTSVPQAEPAPHARHPHSEATGPDGEPLLPERQQRVFASPRARQLA
jgi:pyruvate/2-oxoglutarate dehydrogenase complex dihydrolipoamide acyltransferase (E2) component